MRFFFFGGHVCGLTVCMTGHRESGVNGKMHDDRAGTGVMGAGFWSLACCVRMFEWRMLENSNHPNAMFVDVKALGAFFYEPVISGGMN